ncbi:hypothetical protein RPMA_15490 [Tardiphaga alba]|uniref:Lipocalin-like domain-containing protein n=1 Tax=Tardiphaga alba TaxID=340268 RepID=A0ABX8A8S2_9BRAD|nr:hypothetical protein [Tardiphaga alba]QUS40077.1 hypothetical protein RPMA_15490 [Tardiphaga alba]
MTAVSTFPRAFARTAIFAAAIAVPSIAAFAQSAPFAGMAGVWSGQGNISLDGGAKERIRCKATYAVSGDGNGLNQSLLCASDSYKFELKSNVIAKGNTLSGNWSETTRNVSGELQGTSSAGKFNVNVSAPGFDAKLTLTTTGNKQAVSIASDGQFKGVNITLTRS